MNRSESPGPALFWLVTWYMLAQYMDAGIAFLVSILYWLIAQFAFRMCGRVVFRHGAHGWFLLAQIVGWFALFLVFVPLAEDAKFLLLWGVGIPLIFVGGIARTLCDRHPQFRAVFQCCAQPQALALLLGPPTCNWLEGGRFWLTLAATIASAALSAIPLYYGWMLAEQPDRGDRDAQFGSGDHYREAGMFDER